MNNERPVTTSDEAEKLRVSLKAESILRNAAQKKDDVRKWGLMVVGGLKYIDDPQLQTQVGQHSDIVSALTEWIVKFPASQPHKKGAVMQGALKEIPEYAQDQIAATPEVVQAFVDWLRTIDKPTVRQASFDEFVPKIIKAAVAEKLK